MVRGKEGSRIKSLGMVEQFCCFSDAQKRNLTMVVGNFLKMWASMVLLLLHSQPAHSTLCYLCHMPPDYRELHSVGLPVGSRLQTWRSLPCCVSQTTLAGYSGRHALACASLRRRCVSEVVKWPGRGSGGPWGGRKNRAWAWPYEWGRALSPMIGKIR